MTQDTIDLLQIKIEKAKSQLSENTLKAINSVDWKEVILSMRESKGYSFEQLEDLELETELVLYGLIAPENYPRELESRMGISHSAATALVNEMNEKVFKKIKEELIKITEPKREAPKETETTPLTPAQEDVEVLKSAGIEILNGNAKPEKSVEKPKTETLPTVGELELEAPEEPKPQTPIIAPAPKVEKEVHPILARKLSQPVQTTPVTTEHTLDNLSKSEDTKKYDVDPYREKPE